MSLIYPIQVKLITYNALFVFPASKIVFINFRQYNCLHQHRTGVLPKIRNEGAALGVWGQSPQPPEARGPGGGAPSDRKFCIFLQK